MHTQISKFTSEPYKESKGIKNRVKKFTHAKDFIMDGIRTYDLYDIGLVWGQNSRCNSIGKIF